MDRHWKDMKLIYEVTGDPKNLDNSIHLVNRRLAGDQPNGGNWYDVIEMCAPAAPPIMFQIRTRSLYPALGFRA